MGYFITFEGGEGSGKSTQLQCVAKYLNDLGISVVTTREPGGHPNAEDIRHLLLNGQPDRWLPMSETLLLYAARCEHFHRVITPALQNGSWVLCDRFVDSTLAYQGFGKGLDMLWLTDIYQHCTGGIYPHRTYLLDIDPAVGMTRAHSRRLAGAVIQEIDRFETLDMTFHQNVRKGFLWLAEHYASRICMIDAAQEVDTVFNHIIRDLEQCLLLTPG